MLSSCLLRGPVVVHGLRIEIYQMTSQFVQSGPSVVVLLVWFAIASIEAGCSKADNRRIAVSGKVTYEGKPVEIGSISFVPAAGEDGLAAGGRIENAEYSLPSDAGPSAGTYVVQITVGALQRTPSGPNPSFRIDDVIVDQGGRLDFDLPPD